MIVLHGDAGHNGRQEQYVELIGHEGVAAVGVLGLIGNSGRQAHYGLDVVGYYCSNLQLGYLEVRLERRGLWLRLE